MLKVEHFQLKLIILGHIHNGCKTAFPFCGDAELSQLRARPRRDCRFFGVLSHSSGLARIITLPKGIRQLR